jgi:Flp pilus assembly protein TadB
MVDAITSLGVETLGNKGMRAQRDRREAQRKSANTFRLVMLVAWLIAAIWMTVVEQYGFAGLAYFMVALHIWIEVRRIRRERRFKTAAAEQNGQKKGTSKK